MKEASEEQELERFLQKLQKPASQEPDQALDKAFYALLADEKEAQQTKQKQTNVWVFLNHNYLKYAAVLVGLIGAFWVGRLTTVPTEIEKTKIVYVPVNKPAQQLAQESPTKITQKQPVIERSSVITQIANLKKEMSAVKENQEKLMLTMLQHESASDRLQALNFSYKIEQPNEEVLNALIKTLDEDPSMNVRMAAADAISQFTNVKMVRKALIKSLMKQQEPSLQIAVINILTNAKERKAIPMLQYFAQNENISESVKQQIEESIRILGQE